MWPLASLFKRSAVPERTSERTPERSRVHARGNGRASSVSLWESAMDDLAFGPNQIVRGFPLLHALEQAASARAMVRLNALQFDTWVPTRLVAVDVASKTLFLRHLIDEPSHKALMDASRFNLFLQRDESTMLMTLRPSRVEAPGGQVCYAAQLEDMAISSQTREWRRIRPPMSRPIAVVHQPDGRFAVSAQVVDISEGGFGLSVPVSDAHKVQLHEKWSEAQLQTDHPEWASIGPIDLQVRSVREVDGRQTVGVMIVQASEQQMKRLRCLLMHLQTRHS